MIRRIFHAVKHAVGSCYEIRGDGLHDDWRGIQALVDDHGIVGAMDWLSRRPGKYVVNRTIIDDRRVR